MIMISPAVWIAPLLTIAKRREEEEAEKQKRSKKIEKDRKTS